MSRASKRHRRYEEQEAHDTSERVVPEGLWQDRGGYVKVRGEYVQGGFNVIRVPVKREALTTCQGPCHQVNVALPLVLMVRFENALGRFMYWFGPGPGPHARMCGSCAAREARLEGAVLDEGSAA